MKRFVTAAGAILLLWAATAFGEQSSEEQARALDERAEQLFEEGDHEGALAELEEAQRLLPSTTRLYNMAICEQRRGNIEDALILYQRFVEATNTDASRHESARQHIQELEAQLSGERQPAEEVPPTTEERQPTIEDQQETEEPATEEQRPATEEQPDLISEEPPASESSDRRRLHPAAFFSMLGLTAAAGITTIGLGAATLSRQDDFELTYDDDPNWPDLQQTGRRMATTTNVMLGVTVASAIATLVLGLFTRWRRGSEPSASQSFVPSLSAGGGLLESKARYESCATFW